MEKYAERIKELRREKGYSQIELANLLDVNSSTVAKWESSKAAPTRRLAQLSAIFSVPSDYILGITDTRASFKQARQVVSNLSTSEQEKIKKIFSLHDNYSPPTSTSLQKGGKFMHRDSKNATTLLELITTLNYYKNYPELADAANQILSAIPQLTDESIQKLLTYLSDLEANPLNLKAGESSDNQRTDSGRSQPDV